VTGSSDPHIAERNLSRVSLDVGHHLLEIIGRDAFIHHDQRWEDRSQADLRK
jgi:hypothetical protein